MLIATPLYKLLAVRTMFYVHPYFVISHTYTQTHTHTRARAFDMFCGRETIGATNRIVCWITDDVNARNLQKL